MDITPLIPADRQLIEGYAPGRFRVSGVIYEFPIIVTRRRTMAWPVTVITDLTLESVVEPAGAGRDFDLLLLGCGSRMTLVPSALRAAFKTAGIVLEPMDSGAACRTYNVLLSEDRRVAAALIPV